MADISMCNGHNCTKRETCYRFKAIPNPRRQSYIRPDVTGEKCEHYWKHSHVVEAFMKLDGKKARNKENV